MQWLLNCTVIDLPKSLQKEQDRSLGQFCKMPKFMENSHRQIIEQIHQNITDLIPME